MALRWPQKQLRIDNKRISHPFLWVLPLPWERKPLALNSLGRAMIKMTEHLNAKSISTKSHMFGNSNCLVRMKYVRPKGALTSLLQCSWCGPVAPVRQTVWRGHSQTRNPQRAVQRLLPRGQGLPALLLLRSGPAHLRISVPEWPRTSQPLKRSKRISAGCWTPDRLT